MDCFTFAYFCLRLVAMVLILQKQQEIIAYCYIMLLHIALLLASVFTAV